MASITEIAKRANVSTMTVSNVINKKYQKVSSSTRERVEKVIEEMNYVPNLSARSLKSNNSKIIVFAIPQTIVDDPNKDSAFTNPFYGELINSIEFHLREKGYYLMFRFVNDDERLSSMVKTWSVDGVIVLGALEKELSTIFADIHVPLILIDTYIDSPEYDCITTEDEAGGRMATEYLLDHGYRKLGMVASSIGETGVAQKRYQGYRDALASRGMRFDESMLFEGFPSYEFGIEVASRIAKRKDEFDAMFVYSDLVAIGLINGLKNQGIRVPQDIAVIGFDGLFIGELCEPRLTTIKQDIGAKGQKAVELLVRKLNRESEGVENIVLPVTIVERDSVV